MQLQHPERQVQKIEQLMARGQWLRAYDLLRQWRSQFAYQSELWSALVQVTKHLDGLGEDALHASATRNDDGMLSVQLLNTTKNPIECSLQIGTQLARITVPANSLQTVRVAL